MNPLLEVVAGLRHLANLVEGGELKAVRVAIVSTRPDGVAVHSFGTDSFAQTFEDLHAGALKLLLMRGLGG